MSIAPSGDGADDPAREILDLIEVELGSMIRRLDLAANSVAGGAEATASTLFTIRRRTDALMERASAAHATATSFSHAAENFTLSAHDIAARVRDVRRLTDLASVAAEEARPNVDRLRASSTAIGDVVNLIAQIAKLTPAARPQLHHWGCLQDSLDAASEGSGGIVRFRPGLGGNG